MGSRDQSSHVAGASAGYAVALAATGTIILLRLGASLDITNGDSFLPLVLVIMAAAWLGGMGPGLFATLLGAAAQIYFLLGRQLDIRRAEPRNLAELLIFILIGIL